MFEFEIQGARVPPLQVTRRSRKSGKTGKAGKSSKAAKEVKDGKASKPVKAKAGKDRSHDRSRENDRASKHVKSGRVSKSKAPSAGAHQPPPPQRTRAKANWNDAQDKMLRKYIRKWGHGQWKRIERSGAFPKEYTAVMIKNRALRLASMSSSKLARDKGAEAVITDGQGGRLSDTAQICDADGTPA